MKAYAKRCKAKFDKLSGLNVLVKTGVPGASKAKRALSDSWVNRTPPVGKYWNAKNARAVVNGTAR